MDNEEIQELETSLKNYFLNYNDNNRGPADHSSKMKYRGLSITIDPSQKEDPVFKVRIGAFEASFRVRDGLKTYGSLCGDEKIVIKWFYRGNNQQILSGLVGKTNRESPQMVDTNYVDVSLKIKGN